MEDGAAKGAAEGTVLQSSIDGANVAASHVVRITVRGPSPRKTKLVRILAPTALRLAAALQLVEAPCALMPWHGACLEDKVDRGDKRLQQRSGSRAARRAAVLSNAPRPHPRPAG
eukprot:94898-Chlamydomonas_euryale.AAC.3